MSSRRRSARSGMSLGAFLAINIVPIIGGIVIAVAYATGRITFREIDPRVWTILGVICAAVFLLSFFCWVAYPLVSGGAAAAGAGLARTREDMRRGSALGWVLRLPILAVISLLYLVLWSQRMLVAALVAINILVVMGLVILLLYKGATQN